MLIRVQLHLLCPTEVDAQSVLSAINQKLATKPLRVIHNAVTAFPNIRVAGQWVVAGDVSFTLRVDADDVYGDTQAKWGGGSLRNRILAGSTVTLHVCSHADSEQPPWANCRTIDYQVATKGAG